MNSPLHRYLSETPVSRLSTAFVGYLANLTQVAAVAPEVSRSIVRELRDQRSNLKLIASENYCSLSTQLAMGNLLTDKYAEGFSGARFYEGCNNVDDVESLACAEACKLFGAEHAYVQPHSGADANMVAFWGILQAKVQVPALEEMGVKDPAQLSHADWSRIRERLGNQRLLGLNLAAGGHLTHGFRQNVSGKMFDAYAYGVSEKDGLLDYDAIEAQAVEVKPLILLAGFSAYPRRINFRRMREIADKVGAVLMVDMAHFAGLVAGGVFEGDFNPFPHAQVVTSTTHKTLRGPRGGIVLSTKEFGEFMDKGCPLVLGGPLPHVMAAKAVAFREANQPSFRDYAHRVVENARAFAAACVAEGLKVVSGGTDNHLLLIDVTPFGLTGRQAAAALVRCGITLNKNAIPFDTLSPMITSGLRVGTPAITTLGMGVEEVKEIASIIRFVLGNMKAATVTSGKQAGSLSKIAYELDEAVVTQAQARVRALLDRFPLYPELDLAYLESSFS
jgi:glycine hydroxymethyltransferase